MIYCHLPPKKKKKSATQRRWSLTQVFYASYLERTITNLSGEHGADSFRYAAKLYATVTSVSLGPKLFCFIFRRLNVFFEESLCSVTVCPF